MALSVLSTIEAFDEPGQSFLIKITNNLAVGFAVRTSVNPPAIIARFIDITGGVLDLSSLGPEAVIVSEVNGISHHYAILMRSNKILLCYVAHASGLRAVEVSLNLSTKIITSGASKSIHVGGLEGFVPGGGIFAFVNQPRLTRLSSSKAYAVWADFTNGPPPWGGSRAFACTISFPSLSPGTIDYVSPTQDDFYAPQCVAISSSRVYVTYDHTDFTVDGKQYANIMHISGTTFTRGGSEIVLDSDNFALGSAVWQNTDGLLFSTDKVITVGAASKFVAATTVSSSIIKGTELNIAGSSNTSFARGDSSNIFITYRTSFVDAHCQTINVSGTTLTDNADTIQFYAGGIEYFNGTPARMGDDYGLILYSTIGAKTYACLIGGLPSIFANIPGNNTRLWVYKTADKGESWDSRGVKT